ncbi:MAG TPA: hypothetical protein VF486_07085, partial [Actinomycetes bacterium]
YPGLAATDVFRNARGLPRPLRTAAVAVHRLAAAAPAAAAQTPVFLAHDPGTTGVTGGFFGPGRRRRRIPRRVLRPDRRAALWAASEELVRPWLPDPTWPPRSSGGHAEPAASSPAAGTRNP